MVVVKRLPDGVRIPYENLQLEGYFNGNYFWQPGQ